MLAGPRRPASLLPDPEMGPLSEARELQGRALKGRRKVLGLRHPDTEETEHELAGTIAVLQRQGGF